MTTSTNNISQQANLLACKQWWKVCFLHGDQQKYYRQVYGKAAAERLALAKQAKDDSKSDETATANPTSQSTSISLFPAKQPSRRRSKTHDKQASKISTGIQPIDTAMPDLIKPNSRVTVLDDPFLFGLTTTENQANLSGEDSGIDNAAFETTTTGSDRVLAAKFLGDPNRLGLPPRLPEKRAASLASPPHNQLGIASEAIANCSSDQV